MKDYAILLPELRLGIVSAVSAHIAKINLNTAGAPSGTYFNSGRYGRGEVGEFVLIEGQQNLLLGRIIEICLPDKDRRSVTQAFSGDQLLDAIGHVQLLGSVSVVDELKVTAGVEYYPRLGDRVYAAPHEFIAKVPSATGGGSSNDTVSIELGHVATGAESLVAITPERLFGRHCAILGSTGGGKSWTTARLIEQCIEHDAKIILLDATNEYRSLQTEGIQHCHLGNLAKPEASSVEASLPPTAFSESDFTALFRPSAGVQAPKLREAMSSLRMVQKAKELGKETVISEDGLFIKAEKTYDEINRYKGEFPSLFKVAHDPGAPFDVTQLIGQLKAECVWENKDSYGGINQTHWGHCSTLVSRIAHITHCAELGFVFDAAETATPLPKLISEFLGDRTQKVLRICLSGVSQEYQAKEIVANAIGRSLLKEARLGVFKDQPIIVFVDEAHNFLGRKLGSEDLSSNLDAFEIIAKEGRKFGLCICLATQRPRDITEGVLSQMGTLIVHRLTNDRDRELVERACGEIDKSASAFLPTLQPGEAAIIGVDFPIPLTIKVIRPTQEPKSDGPKFQQSWKVK
tara:strand:- start:4492 stop:6216 length:1725 start_codon:yes stop_codon:yes gene_type:complete